MIKLVFCLHRRPDLTREAFQRYWLDQHAPLVALLAPVLRIRRYVQAHTLAIPELETSVAARGIAAQAFDGVAQLYWDSIEDVMAVGATREEREASRRLIADEKNFIDLPRSPLFFTQEYDILAATR